MSDEAINITIPQGPRAEKIRAVHAISKTRRLEAIDARIAEETNPEVLQQLQQLRDSTANEGVNKFILTHFKNMVLLEEREIKGRELQEAAKASIRQAIKDYLDQFGGI